MRRTTVGRVLKEQGERPNKAFIRQNGELRPIGFICHDGVVVTHIREDFAPAANLYFYTKLTSWAYVLDGDSE